MKTSKILSLLLAAALIFSLASCSRGSTQVSPSPAPEVSPGVSPAPSPEQTPTPTPDVPEPSAAQTGVRLAFLNGPTGVGAAKLLSDIDAGATAGSYTYEVAADNSEIVGMLSGPAPEVDIAAIATNMALNLYNKTDGGVQLLALNTLGVLYVLEREGASINNMADLAGKTVYATGQGANPEYIFSHLLTQNGLDPERDLTIQWVTPEEVSQAFLSGEADAALLPVPAVTALMAKCKAQGLDFHVALDLTEQWDRLGTGSTLTMGCLAVRTQFARENPEAVAQFLAEYAASIDYVNTNPEEAAALVTDHGLAPSAAIAQSAIPDCHLVCITGADIQPSIDGYYAVLFQANPAAIGGSLPDDAFYYVP